MIVDDSRTVRLRIKSVLQGEAIEIVEFADGQEAIDGYAAHEPDLVLMDLEMAHVDGFEATRQIKAQFPDARIMILTSFDNDEIKAAALASGASGYLLKQNIEEIRALVRGAP